MRSIGRVGEARANAGLLRASYRRPLGLQPVAPRQLSHPVSWMSPPNAVQTVQHEVEVLTPTAPEELQQAAAPFPGRARVHHLDPVSFEDFLENNQLVLVDYYTDWCGPCKLMHQELDKLTKAFPKGVAFAKINCGHWEEFGTAQRIRTLPTFRLFKGGRCVEQVTGAKPSELRQALAYHYRPS